MSQHEERTLHRLPASFIEGFSEGNTMLTQEQLKELLHYDPETGLFTWRVAAGRRVRTGLVAGHIDKCPGYVTIKINRKKYLGHRLAWLYVHGDLPPEEIDHINRAREDNRICNLRLATCAENAQNRKISSSNTSGHIGVHWFKRTQQWYAKITLNTKRIHLGCFNHIEDAIAARKAAEQKYHTFQHA